MFRTEPPSLNEARLYFAELRSSVVLWTEIVIWTSVLGTFLKTAQAASGM
jgi:hypothetical protein